MYLLSQVQNLIKAVWISHSANIFLKRYDSNYFLQLGVNSSAGWAL